MHIIKTGTLTAVMVKSNLKGTVERFFASGNPFSFMSSVRGTPAYWKQFLYYVLAMVKRLGIPKYFLTLSYADLRCEELPCMINKLNYLSDEELKHIIYQERYNLLK